jgi:hypothetical protein
VLQRLRHEPHPHQGLPQLLVLLLPLDLPQLLLQEPLPLLVWHPPPQVVLLL